MLVCVQPPKIAKQEEIDENKKLGNGSTLFTLADGVVVDPGLAGVVACGCRSRGPSARCWNRPRRATLPAPTDSEVSARVPACR